MPSDDLWNNMKQPGLQTKMNNKLSQSKFFLGERLQQNISWEILENKVQENWNSIDQEITIVKMLNQKGF